MFEALVHLFEAPVYQFEPFLYDLSRQSATPTADAGNTPAIDPSEIDTIIVPAREDGFRETFLGENMWRAIRFGLDGRLVDLERAEEYPAREAIERLMAWTAPVRSELAIEPAFPERNGAQRQRLLIEAGATREEVFAASVKETRQTYAQEVAV